MDFLELKIEYDADKRQRTLETRGLDFEPMAQLLQDFYLQRTDDRRDYGEVRYIVLGALNGPPITAVWTPRGDAIRVISMRIADDEEREIYWREHDRSG